MIDITRKGSSMRLLVLMAAVLALAGAVDVSAQSEIDTRINSTRGELNEALNQWTEEALLGARGGFERLLDRGGRDWLVRYYLALADYRLAIWNLSTDQKDDVRTYLDEADDMLNAAIEEEPTFAEAHSLLGAVLGIKIGLKPISGMWIGPRIGGILAEATQLDPENPRTWMVEGVGAYHRPKMFGGGYDNAREAMLKSLAFYETYAPADPAYPDWGHAEAYAWLGKMEMEHGEFASAEKRLDKALEIDSQLGWVIYVLSPQLAELKQSAKVD